MTCRYATKTPDDRQRLSSQPIPHLKALPCKSNRMQDNRLLAWQFAGQYHAGQVYGDALPYLYHLGQVYLNATMVAEQEPDLDLNLLHCCAILHDILEDTEMEEAALSKAFGLNILAGVKALTKDGSLPDKSQQMADSLLRIQQQPREVAIVKMCDRISNLSRQPPSWWTAEKTTKYATEGLLIAKELGAYSSVAHNRLLKTVESYQQAYL